MHLDCHGCRRHHSALHNKASSADCSPSHFVALRYGRNVHAQWTVSGLTGGRKERRSSQHVEYSLTVQGHILAIVLIRQICRSRMLASTTFSSPFPDHFSLKVNCTL